MTAFSRRTFGSMVAGVSVGAIATACANIPTSGPVDHVSPSAPAPASQGVDIAPNPPVSGATPELILAGFLTAMSSFQPGYPVAREYLTPEASKGWNPDAGATIYNPDLNKPVTTADSASLVAPIVGNLDGAGRFTPSGEMLKHDFGMKKSDGQWRISNPPEGLLIARYLFVRYYVPMKVNFLALDGRGLVAETVYLPERTVTPAAALQALLAGPSPWLRPAVGNLLPADTGTDVTSIVVGNDGVAQVSLSKQAGALTESLRRGLMAQLVTTLAPFAGVKGVRATLNSQPWPVPGHTTADAFTPDDVRSFQVLDDRVNSELFAVQKGAVGTLPESGGPSMNPLSGPLGTSGGAVQPGALAVSRTASALTIVNPEGTNLWVADGQEATPRLQLKGTKITRPQMDGERAVWTTMVEGGALKVVHVDVLGRTTARALEGLPVGSEVVAFKVSPDRSRAAMIITSGKSTILGLWRVRMGTEVQLDGWRPLTLTATSGRLTTFKDVAWSDPGVLLLLAASAEDPQTTVYRVSVEGASVESLGPGALDSEAVQLEVFPRASGTTCVVLTKDKRVLRYEDRFRWRQVATGVDAVCFAG